MSTSANDILLVIALDFSLFLVLVLIFAIYRKIRSKKVDLAKEITVLHPYMNEAEHSWRVIFSKLKDMDLPEVYSELGEWAFMYLSLHRFFIICLIAMGIPGTLGLLLIYYYGNDEGSDKDSIHLTSISHIIDQPNLLIYPVLFLLYFSLVIYGLGIRFLYNMLYLRTSDHLMKTQNTVVMIRNIFKQHSSNFITEKLHESLEKHFQNSIQSIYTVPYLVEPYGFYKKVKKSEKKLKLLNLDFELNGEKTQIRKKCKKIDGISFYEAKIFKYSKKMTESREKFKDYNAGVAFVMLTNSTAAYELIQSGVDPLSELDTSNFECLYAPISHDILWENIGIDRSYALLMKIFLNLVYVLLFLVLITPSAFEEFLIVNLDYLGLKHFLISTLAISLPALVLVIYQLLILPPAVNLLVKNEKHTKKHTKITSSLKKYLFFLLFYTLFFPILQLQLTGVIEMFLHKDWQAILGTKVKYTGELFFVFIIHQMFLKNGFDLIVASKYFLSAAKALFVANSRAEEQLCFEAEPFEFDFELAVSLNAFAVICGLSVIFPLILVPGVLFFVIRVIGI
jgi:hypothetical protein